MRSAPAACERPTMSTTGPATFYDGLTSARHDATVELVDGTLRINAGDGRALTEWRCAEIAPVSTPDGVLRLGLPTPHSTARLEIHDKVLADAVVKAGRPCDRTGLTDHHTRLRVVGFSFVAVVVLIAAGIWGVPVIADKVTPLLPIALDVQMGDIFNVAFRQQLDGMKDAKTLECASADTAQAAAAKAAFIKLVGMLTAGAGLPLPVEVVMVHVKDVNAVTLPGGHIYVYDGIPASAMRVDEMAGVIGHEMGHVDHRDGVKTQVQSGGMSVLFGLLLGDFTGGGAVVFTATKLLQNAYSRKAESAADLFGATLMAKIGGDPHALGEFLLRLSGSAAPQDHFLLDHPEAQIRAAAIDQVPQPSPMKALLTPDEWTALKGICIGD
jgi:Zn-dependent protease with chaperone function